MLNDAGQTVFRAGLTGSGVDFTNDDGIWSEGFGSLALVARQGDQVPGMPSGVNFGDFFNFVPLLNNAGQTAFSAGISGPGLPGSSSVWSEGSGALALVARTGDQAPGAASGVNFGGLVNPLLNDIGQTEFRAVLTGSGVVQFVNDSGFFSEGSGSLALVARTGDQAPGVPSGVNFRNFTGGPSALNNAGQTAFAGLLIGGGVDAANNQGIWSEGSGSLALVARSGDHAPGTPSGTKYSSFSNPVLNDAGQTTFKASITGSGVDFRNNDGIWSEGFGSLALVAREGDHAPGTPSGVNFGNFDVGIVLNNAGQTAFMATTTASGARYGIWATDRNGAVQLIAHRGDLLEVAPGDIRTISYLGGLYSNPTGNSDGRRSFFNNSGQLAFLAGFTDGTSGIFVSNRVAIPEPSAFALAGLATLAAAFMLRRQRQ